MPKTKKVEWPKLDSFWKENDSRFDRYVIVKAHDRVNGKVGICSVSADQSRRTARMTWASVERFNGGSRGYIDAMTLQIKAD